MAFIHEIQIKSAGFPGAPGYTNLYFATAIAANRDSQFAAAKQFLDTISGSFPTTWSGQIQPAGRVLEATTGALGEFSAAPTSATAAKSGTKSEGFGAGVAGLVIGWMTGTVNRARLVRGRTFLVPLSAFCYDPDGTLKAITLSDMDSAAFNLIDANVGFGIWSRPRGGTGGVLAPALTFHVNDRAAFLTSRRA